MAAIVVRLWRCPKCGLEVMTYGGPPSLRYDDGCRALPLAPGRFANHAWDESGEPAADLPQHSVPPGRR